MRTKTLVAAAVALAAGVATSMAQSNVYSVNIVGYVNQVCPVGFTMAATPLKGTNDQISTLIPNPPANTVVYKFVGGGYQPANIYDPGEGGWSSPGMLLPAGQGYFIKSPSLWTNTFVGEVVLDSTNALIAGFSMVGSVAPIAGQIDTTLQLVPTLNDTIYAYNNGAGYRPANIYDPGEGGWASVPNATLAVGQGIFYKSVGAKSWIQHFVIP